MTPEAPGPPRNPRRQLGLFGETEVPPPTPARTASLPQAARGARSPAASPAPSARAAARPALSLEEIRARIPAGHVLAEVAVAGVVRGTFTYLAPLELQAELAAGALVEVPFGAQVCEGYYLGPRTAEDLLTAGLDPARFKSIRKRLDGRTLGSAPEGGTAAALPLLTPELLDLGRWIAGRYACALGTALAAMLPAGVKSGSEQARIHQVRAGRDPGTLRQAARELAARAPKQAALLELVAGSVEPFTQGDLLERCQAGEGVLKSLLRKGLLRIELLAADSLGTQYLAAAGPPEGGGTPGLAAPAQLTLAQLQALRAIREHLDRGSHRVFLLQGVTGSGKTEVYVKVLERTLVLGRQAIVLVPEIALTPQTAARFEARLGRERVAVLHSHLTGGERAEAWRAIRAGRIDLVIGARSALFAPLDRLGCVILDEEHESSFKQETTPRYQARAVAEERARRAGAVLILGSATPSLESSHAARTGRYELLLLPERVAGRELPPVQVVDMREENRETKKYNYLSRLLRQEIQAVLERKDQAILFLNRLGFATVITCIRCGHTEHCQACDITLTSHKARGVLRCHYCGSEKPVPKACLACGAPGLKFWGQGTERVEGEVLRHFPQARVARMDSATMSRRSSYLSTLAAFQKGELDLLIGTQMIAKGLDFPNVTLVGIVLADTALHMPDFRSRERTFQLLEQVAGRAGRGEKGGRVIIQTYLPEDLAIRHAARHDLAGFLNDEFPVRKAFGYPPFAHLARVLVRGRDLPRTREAAAAAGEALKEQAVPLGCTILGPAPASIERLEGWYRFHILVKAARAETLECLFAGPAWTSLCRLKGAEAQVDVDPYSML